MRKDGEWGDYFLIWAVARALQKRIRVVTSSNSDQYERAVGQEGQPELLLGLIGQFHFVSLEPEDVEGMYKEVVEISRIMFIYNHCCNTLRLFVNQDKKILFKSL